MHQPPPRGPRASLRALCLVSLGLATAPAAAQTGSTSAPLIQGTASLVEPFDATDRPELAAVVIETQGALMLTSALTVTETTASLNATPTLSELWQLCPGEPFEEQPTAAFCSGTLIAADLVLTAEHCVPNKRSCEALSVVFDYRYTSAGVLAPLERDDVYGCSRILVSDATGDFALIRLDRPVVGRVPAVPRFTDPSTCFGVDDGVADGVDDPVGERVWAAGFPSGVPLKLDLGDLDGEGVPEGVLVVDESITNRHFFRAGFDLVAGMDGGGVFNQELELVGFLSAGRADYARNDDGCYANVRVSDSPSELAGHVIQPLVSLCNQRSDYPTLCPATVSRCARGDAGVGFDAGTRAFPPQVGCGCRVPAAHGTNPNGARTGALLSLGLVGLLALRARRRYSRTSPRAKMLAT